MDDLNEEGRKLTQKADADNRNLISRQIGNINERWHAIMDKAESAKKSMEEVHQKWDDFLQSVKALTSSQSSLEHRLDHMDLSPSSKKHLHDVVGRMQASIFKRLGVGVEGGGVENLSTRDVSNSEHSHRMQIRF